MIEMEFPVLGIGNIYVYVLEENKMLFIRKL